MGSCSRATPAARSVGTRGALPWTRATSAGARTAWRSAATTASDVRVAFALDCCDREAISFVATTSGITGEDVRDLMVAAVEHRFGRVNRLPVKIEWLTDNGSCYLARETRRFARDVGLVPCTTPLESPQSNAWLRRSCAP